MPTQYSKYTLDNNTHKTTTTIHTANQQQLHKIQLKTSNNVCFDFSTIYFRNVDHFKSTGRDFIINAQKSSCKVAAILVRF